MFRISNGLPAWAVGLLGAALLVGGLVYGGRVVPERAATAPLEQRGPYRPELVILPAGELVMGSPADEEGREDDEAQHTVRLTRPFALGRTEVTQGQWTALMGRNPSYFQGARTGGPEHPVERVSWFEAVVYLNRLSEAEGLSPCYTLTGCRGELSSGCASDGSNCEGDYTCTGVTFAGLDCPGYRLPTEAEWEYAARATTTTPVYAGVWQVLGENNAPVLDPIAWYGGNSATERGVDCSAWPEKQRPGQQCGSQPVGQKQANAWGLHDMLGNVWEWTHDAYVAELTEATDPLQAGDSAAARRVYRGCAWDYFARRCRAAIRSSDEPARRYDILGLRPARSFPRPLNP